MRLKMFNPASRALNHVPKYRSIGFGISIILLALILFFFSRINYLLFHSVAELYSIVIASAVFLISWNVRHQIENQLLVYLGIAYLCIGILDLFHTLSYVGMNIFTDYDYYANQLWIGARYLEATTLFLFFVLTGTKARLNSLAVMGVYAIVTLLILLSVFYWKVFPVCFIEGQGLTPFKKISEYIISGILLVTLILVFKKRSNFDVFISRLLMWAIVLTILGELAFTFYISNYGFSNLIGHYLKIASFYLIYKALIETGLKRPFDLLLRDLKKSEQRLTESQRELMESNQQLTREIEERTNAEERIRANLKEKELLLQEIHHRVKNNMGLVAGFLTLQMAIAKDEETKAALLESQNRVETISLIHETIYQSDDLATIDLRIYLKNLVGVISKGLNIRGNITFEVDAEKIQINARQASPIGIIVNELVTNALKYAFPDGRRGKIRITVQEANGTIKLVISDDGIGFSQDIDFDTVSSLGLRMVKQITQRQLNGVIELDTAQGTQFSIDINTKNF